MTDDLGIMVVDITEIGNDFKLLFIFMNLETFKVLAATLGQGGARGAQGNMTPSFYPRRGWAHFLKKK